jgi:hypothetical protein
MRIKFLEALYTKVFINIIVENHQSAVYIEVCSKDKVINTVYKKFDTVGINSKMYELINLYIKESPFNYISVLDKSPSQGAIPTCVNSEMGKYGDMSSVKYICVSKEWAAYTAEYDLNAIKNEYRSIGVDFIFSPFLIIRKFFKDKIESTLAMFVLVEDSHISLSIFDNSKLLYAKYLDMQSSKEDELLMDSSLVEEDEDLDSIDLTDISIDYGSESLDDFSNIEDLDVIDEIDEFAEALDIEKIVIRDDVHSDSDEFNEDYQRFVLIQSSLSSFYKDEKYTSQFVEKVYIADSIGLSGDFKRYLEEEMFLSVFVRKIDLCAEVCEMAKAELNEI